MFTLQTSNLTSVTVIPTTYIMVSRFTHQINHNLELWSSLNMSYYWKLQTLSMPVKNVFIWLLNNAGLSPKPNGFTDCNYSGVKQSRNKQWEELTLLPPTSPLQEVNALESRAYTYSVKQRTLTHSFTLDYSSSCVLLVIIEVDSRRAQITPGLGGMARGWGFYMSRHSPNILG